MTSPGQPTHNDARSFVVEFSETVLASGEDVTGTDPPDTAL
jgi:hypothetical protein